MVSNSVFKVTRIIYMYSKIPGCREELNDLKTNLDRAQREHRFNYCPKRVEEVRWRGDIRLKTREKSVDHIRRQFASFTPGPTTCIKILFGFFIEKSFDE